MREDWIECKFGDIITFKNGYAFKSTGYLKSGVPVIRIGDIKENEVLIENAICVDENIDLKEYEIVKDDILIAMSGATTGKFGRYNLKEKAYLNQRVGNIKPLSNKYIYKSFLYYLLSQLKREIEKSAYGGAQPNISSKKIEELTVAFAPVPEQRAIVKKLESLFSSLDAGVTDLKKAQQQLKMYRQAVLKKAFEGNWTEVKLDDVAKWGSGGTPSRKNPSFFNGTIYWIKTGELNSKFIYKSEEKISEEAIKKSSAKVFPKGSVAIAMYGATIGKTAIFGSEMSTNQACAVAQCYDIIFNEFLYYFLLSQKQQFIKLGIGGAQPNISQGTIKNYPIKLPSISEQNKIVKQIESRLSVCDSIEQNIAAGLEKAEALRQSILKKAFEGNLLTAQELAECKQADDYEPASVLLERIKAEQNTTITKPGKRKPSHSVAKHE